MARLIFNADDLGLSKGVNSGILYCYQNGVVNSASLMSTGNHFDEAVAMIHDYHLDNIGLHFNLTEGIPLLTGHKTLCDETGHLQREVHNIENIDLREVYDELVAQFKKAEKAGVQINHLDSHHHIHMTAQLRKVFVEFSKKYNLPLRRIRNTARHPFRIFSFYRDTFGAKYFTRDFSADFYAAGATEENLKAILQSYRGNDLEIMCHPGYADDENGVYNNERQNELKVLTSDKIKTQFKKLYAK